ncbi:MAG: hypothetical protein HYR85_27405 [Planctomycetes bacterium]|nr:hypothetical protein [Planctomycetota bacterium]MBI3845510.1 hypothetical protein [Planctomycetota bacterium]
MEGARPPCTRRLMGLGTSFGLMLLAACHGASSVGGEPGEPGRLKVLLTVDSAAGNEIVFRVGAVEIETPEGVARLLFAGPTAPLSTATLGSTPAVLGEASLPPNLYRGISVRIVDAHREGATREELTVHPGPAWVRGVFKVRSGAETSVILSIDLSRSFPSATEFVPALGVRGSQKRPRRALLLVALSDVPRVVTLDREDGERVGTVTTDCPPGGILVSMDQQRLFVAEPETDSVALVDLSSFAVLDRARIPFGSHPRDVAMPPGGRFVFVACEGTNELFVFDSHSLGRVTSLDAGQRPNRVMSDPLGERVYVISPLGRELRVVDARTPKLLSRVPLDPEPVAIAFSRDGSRYFVGHRMGDAVIAFDRRTDTQVGRSIVGPGTVDLASDPSSNRIYVIQESPPRLLYVDASTLSITRSVALPKAPRRVVVDPDTASLFVTLRDRPEVLLVDRIGGRVKGTYPLDSVGTEIKVVP